MNGRAATWLKPILLTLLVTLITLVLLLIFQISNFHPEVVDGTIIQKPQPRSLESKILMTGEVFWGRYTRDASLASSLKYAYPFSGLQTFNKNDYDVWYAQLECPITDNNLTSAQQEATLTFNCRPEFLEEAAKWFDFFNLANNHTDNMGGQAGLNQSRKYIEEVGIQHHGHYDNGVLSELCEVVDLPVRINYSNNKSISTTFPVAFCGFHNVFQLPTEEELGVIKDYSKYFLTIVSPQMGAEYVAEADELKTQTYRAMIDRGADAVIASHPHWVQNTEVYKGKLIVYSVGNFMFDQQDTLEVRRGTAIDLTIGIEKEEDLKSWLNADFICVKFKDDCLKKAQTLNLKKPNFDLRYDAIPSYSTNYVTSKASTDVASGVLERLNWQSSMKQLEDIDEDR